MHLLLATCERTFVLAHPLEGWVARATRVTEGVSLNRNNTPSYRRPKGGVYLMGRFTRSLRALGMRMEKKLYPSLWGSPEIFPPFIALFVFHFLCSSAKPLLNHATIAWFSLDQEKATEYPLPFPFHERNSGSHMTFMPFRGFTVTLPLQSVLSP